MLEPHQAHAAIYVAEQKRVDAENKEHYREIERVTTMPRREFEPTHRAGDELFQIIQEPGKAPYFIDEAGKRRAPGKGPKLEKIPAPYQPTDAPGEDEFPVSGKPTEDEVLSAEDHPFEKFQMTLAEFTVCADAIRTQFRAEDGPTVAVHKGGNVVSFSRKEAGVDVRRLVKIPEVFLVHAAEID